ncbi:hypothetical protein CY34DRAFT_101137 [Suillus luteus UH-Slu-Lm8-n1]|uniref:Uncharacterized protein n=1 Tax=Suillus luteus UH-Slu-Lm8-n1 TaxID=930992 RepID=A0A0D0AL27_9AGAM|nr:hypothetical protein CY34DRAFT_101137 [Suillus luteus UH-Slu-Lm8-n1]
MGDEVTVEITETEERTDFFHRSWYCPFAYSRKLGRIHCYLSWFNDHSEVINFLCVKGAFFGFQEKGFFADDFEDSAGFRENENVIHINNHPSFGDLLLERLIHVGLECGRRIAKSKEHDFWFEESK